MAVDNGLFCVILLSIVIKVQRKNLHVPMPEPLYRRLRTEAERTGRPATDLAREAIDHWLAEQQRRNVFDAIQAYAHRTAGTRDDLDPRIEAAAIECLSSSEIRQLRSK